MTDGSSSIEPADDDAESPKRRRRLDRTAAWLWMVAALLVIIALVPHAAAGQRITPSITEQELADYVRRLELSEEQSAVARSFYQDYREEYTQSLLPLIRAHHDAETELIRSVQRSNGAIGWLDVYPAHWDERDELHQQILALEERFFSQLESLLDTPDVQRMERVRNARARVRYRVVHLELPESNVDLIGLVDNLGLSADTCRTLEQHFLSHYENRYIILLKAALASRYKGAEQKWELDDLNAQLRQRDLTDDERGSIRRKAEAAARSISRDRIGTLRTLVSFNREALAAIEAHLPADDYQRLVQLYKQTAYPEVHPDPVNAAQLYRVALGPEMTPQLSDEQQDTIERLAEESARTHRTLSSSMERALVQMMETALEHDVVREDIDLLRGEVIALGLQRERHNEMQYELLRQILTSEQFTHLPEWNFDTDPPRRRWWPRTEWERERRIRKEQIENWGDQDGGRGEGGLSDSLTSDLWPLISDL